MLKYLFLLPLILAFVFCSENPNNINSHDGVTLTDTVYVTKYITKTDTVYKDVFKTVLIQNFTPDSIAGIWYGKYLGKLLTISITPSQIGGKVNISYYEYCSELPYPETCSSSRSADIMSISKNSLNLSWGLSNSVTWALTFDSTGMYLQEIGKSIFMNMHSAIKLSRDPKNLG
jgi:hypothetical protein